MPDYELLQLLDKYSQMPVIVEGKKDLMALESVGFSDVVLYSKPAYAVAEALSSRDVSEAVILTDLDTAGKKKYVELKRALTREGIKVNDELRIYLFKKTQLSHIEGLDTYLANQ